MKDPSEKHWYSILLLAFLSIMLCIPGGLVAFKYFPNSFEMQFLCMSGPGIITFLVANIILGIKFQKAYKEYDKWLKEHSNEKLNSEFQKVHLKTFDGINKEAVECQAKVNNDGKIICKVHLDIEDEFSNYEEFVKFFSCEDTKK